MENLLAVVQDGSLIDPHGADVVVPWWSYTKTIMAAAALVLASDQRLALDEPLRERPYTLRQLLQHRAGVSSYGGLAAYHEAVARDDEPWPVAELLKRTQAERLLYPPGKGWAYSNIGYLFVRNLIEEACGEDLGVALTRLVLDPLGIAGARMPRERADFAGAKMGVPSYHPGWVYHGLLIGPLGEAALLLDRLMSGVLLEPAWLDQMRDALRLAGPVAGRPWRELGYGLGLMCGEATNGSKVIGHTGGGPGSVVAVYHLPREAQRLTAASFAFGEDPLPVEEAVFGRATR
ncbi:MAG TPA: serine hydrolase domain-containing protein [Xanthobacteraceae bacterium]